MQESADRSAIIFGNAIDRRTYAKACRTKARYVRQFGPDEHASLQAAPAPVIGEALGVQQLLPDGPALPQGASAPGALPNATDAKPPVVIGTIRMGFGHYRIAMALASAAHALGRAPYWLDLMAFPDTLAGKVIARQNQLYSLGSRLSQRSRLFNALYWEPLNSEGFRKLTYNAGDQKTAELFGAPFAALPRDVPLLAAHAYPAQAAVHAGLTRVVNCIPDNWPMALHLAEGSLHTVQTPSAYLGYKMLRGFAGAKPLRPMPAGSLECVGHYVDAELVRNAPDDCARRIARLQAGSPMRFLLTVGGAGAQRELFAALCAHLAPYVEAGRAALLVNVGDHADVWDALVTDVPALSQATRHFDDFAGVAALAQDALDGPLDGIHAFCDHSIFGAVYSTNVLMRAADVLVTKPSELSFYPVPKLMIRRVGGHEAWGAVRAAELGDGTYEMETPAQACAMVDALLAEPELVEWMCANICAEAARGTYDGAFRAVELACAQNGK